MSETFDEEYVCSWLKMVKYTAGCVVFQLKYSTHVFLSVLQRKVDMTLL